MKLIQRNSRKFPAQLLPRGDDEINTGPMTECVSVIVLCNHNGNRYQQARGYHGGGGIENVNFDNLFRGIPNHQTTRIIVIAGLLRYGLKDFRVFRKTIEKEINRHHLSLAAREYRLGSNVKVNRKGVVTGCLPRIHDRDDKRVILHKGT